MDFNEFKLNPLLNKGISQAGYVVATPIQQKAIPVVLQGKDLIGTAQTGTGKTAAFVLPILNKLLSSKKSRCRALILTPTRELAEQIHNTIIDLATGTKIKSATIYGGVNEQAQLRALRYGTEILVACPGRLIDLAERTNEKFEDLDILVLDEADRMFDMGFLPAINKIIDFLPTKRQTLLFSATFPPEIEKLSYQCLNNPERIAVGISRPAYTVSHALYPVPDHLKVSLLKNLLKTTPAETVLIFTRTKHRAKRLAVQVGRFGHETTSLHGNCTQGQRQKALSGFKEGKFQIMVATDIAARGLDIDGISHVINYDVPDTAEAYIHRIGRTGRAERTGDAFTLATPQDESMIKIFERILGQKLDRNVLEGFDYSKAAPRKMYPLSGTGKPAGQNNRRPTRYNTDSNKENIRKDKEEKAVFGKPEKKKYNLSNNNNSKLSGSNTKRTRRSSAQRDTNSR